MSMEESISLEETNKIRISLGLKPLTDDKEPVDDEEKQAADNYAKRRANEAKDRETKSIVDRIAKVRNRRELNTSLKGATLGDADADTDNTLKWIKKSKKKEKELAKKRLEELESMDKMFQEEYTERDLVGLKVSHDFDDMDEGEAHILTLKDSRVLDNEEDELQNVEMAEEDRRKKIKETKIKNRDYTGYDDEEFVEGSIGLKRSVLSKYDEDIEGTPETGFRLGTNAVSKKAAQAEEQIQAAAIVNKSLLSIDYIKNIETADYLKEGDIGFKKPKTKKKRPSRRAPAEADPDEMDVDDKPAQPRVRDLDVNFVDDDELQAALARSRKAKLFKPKKVSPEELARQIAQEREEQANTMDLGKIEDVDSEGLTFDDTSEFIRAVGNNPITVKAESRSPSRDVSMAPPGDVQMASGDQVVSELEAGEVAVKEEEDEEDDMAMLDAIESLLKEADEEESKVVPGLDEVGGTSAEQTYKSGMASTLNILRQQGILATPSSEQKERERIQLQRDRWLADQRRKVMERETAKMQSRGGNKDQATREYDNRLREQQEARENMESFKNYKPDVNIVYYDEFGRALTPKEAWKALSHRFHGKGSGKMKTEKRLKKIADEQKKAAMASGDTPLSMSHAFQQRQEKTGQAHFVLSVGNRGAVPQLADFIDAQPLSKSKTEKAKKKKESKNAAAAGDTGFITLPAPISHSVLDSPIPSGSGLASGTGTPNEKPGFSRISSAMESSSHSGTPVPAERSKVAFGFGTKRKAAEELGGTPPPKRR
ncbi:SART-1 family-domain-containing protein [Mycena floridula]|nr:SART-1 family-domain-containing protein [Mycena floridula]